MAIAFCLASGVDANPVQGIYTIVLMVASLVCFSIADASTEHSEKTDGTESAKSVNIKMEDAA